MSSNSAGGSFQNFLHMQNRYKPKATQQSCHGAFYPQPNASELTVKCTFCPGRVFLFCTLPVSPMSVGVHVVVYNSL